MSEMKKKEKDKEVAASKPESMKTVGAGKSIKRKRHAAGKEGNTNKKKKTAVDK